MIEFVKGDILESDCQALVNTVNCYGKMGKGLALLFKNKFPHMFNAYKNACRKKEVKTGQMHIWKNPESRTDDKARPVYVVNFPTKDHWKQPSQMEWIICGLQNLVEEIKEKGITSIGIPPLGCGLGGLNWYQVRAEIQRVHDLHWSDIRVVVYEP